MNESSKRALNRIEYALQNPNTSEKLKNYFREVKNKTLKNIEAKRLANEEKQKQQTMALQKNKNIEDKKQKLKSFEALETIRYKGQEGYVLFDSNKMKDSVKRDAIRIRLNPGTSKQSTFTIEIDDIEKVERLGGKHTYNPKEDPLSKGGKSTRKLKRKVTKGLHKGGTRRNCKSRGHKTRRGTRDSRRH